MNPAPPHQGAAGQSTEVLEVVDEGNVIVRVWYQPTALPARERTDAGDATFVDLWLQGIDTSALKPGMSANFKQAFQVTGNKSFSTTCGSRSLPLLEPVGAASNSDPAP